MVSVLLVCPSGLEQTSLITSVNAMPRAVVTAKATGAASALSIIQNHPPDVILADAYLLQEELSQLLKQVKEQRPEIVRVVLTAVSSQQHRLQQEGADYVLNYSDLNQQFPQILNGIQAGSLDRVAPE